MRGLKTFGFLFVLLFLFSFLLTGCLCRMNGLQPTRLQQGIDSILVIRTEAMAEYSGVEEELEKEGIAISLGDGLILSLSHTTTFRSFIKETMYTPMGIVSREIPRQVSGYRYSIGSLELELVGRKEDVSLFRGGSFPRFPFEFGDSDELKLGDEIVFFGFPYNRFFTMEAAVVSVLEYGWSSCLGHCFLIQTMTHPGDSGAPLLTLRGDGEMEMVGLVFGHVAGDLGIVYRSNYVRELIRSILSGDREEEGFNYFDRYPG